MDAKPVLDLSKHFGAEQAPEYDFDIRRRIPGYETLHATARAVLESRLGAQARILVVGAGTGEELLACAQARPDWRFVGVDPSADMLAIANKKIASAHVGDRVRLHRGTVADLQEQEPFDAATALLVMHFLADDGGKQSFLQTIADRMKPGATFVLADMTGQPGTPEFEVLYDTWKAYWCATHALPASDQTMAKEFEERRARVGWIDEDRHLELFAATGFSEPVRFWSGLLFCAWAMHKA